MSVEADHTLLGIVQNVLNSMNSDAVSTLGETEESLEVAEVAKEVYDEMLTWKDWPFMYSLIKLEGMSDITRPNYLKLSDNVMELATVEIKYEDTETGDTDRNFKSIHYKHPQEFVQFVHQRHTSDAEVIVVVDYSGVELFIKNDAAPTYWTSFDDSHIVFDSYNAVEDDTLKSSKSVCFGFKRPDWQLQDTFVPVMPDKFFPTFKAAVRARCHEYYKDAQSPSNVKATLGGINRLKTIPGKSQNVKQKSSYGRRGAASHRNRFTHPRSTD